jgi:hypothetical protein
MTWTVKYPHGRRSASKRKKRREELGEVFVVAAPQQTAEILPSYPHLRSPSLLGQGSCERV